MNTFKNARDRNRQMLELGTRYADLVQAFCNRWNRPDWAADVYAKPLTKLAGELAFAGIDLRNLTMPVAHGADMTLCLHRALFEYPFTIARPTYRLWLDVMSDLPGKHVAGLPLLFREALTPADWDVYCTRKMSWGQPSRIKVDHPCLSQPGTQYLTVLKGQMLRQQTGLEFALTMTTNPDVLPPVRCERLTLTEEGV